jgi:CubicO group peptidase (beta-lactamase class C family)
MISPDRSDRKGKDYVILITGALLILTILLTGCGPSKADLAAVDFKPQLREDWKVSTPEEQGLDPDLIARLYYNAAELETLYSLLIVKNGYLIAEDYFNGGLISQQALLKSVNKSYTSALVGIALDQGCLSSVNQKLIEFFPELADQITDPRKLQITIEDLLKMRSGYPREEIDPALWDAIWLGDYVPLIVDFPLVNDPGAAFNYSCLTSNLLGIIVTRACENDLKSFAQENLFNPIGAKIGHWNRDKDGYYISCGDIYLTARDAAKFGLLYLNDGEYLGDQVISTDWVGDSLKAYTENAFFKYKVGRHLTDIGYGYQWWSAKIGDHQVNLAWGHGGQLIVLLDKYDLVIVTTADPFHEQHEGESWKHEEAIINLIAEFINSLPKE